ncbi:MAG: cytidylate kinase family protein [Candidatus Aenigmarchaeota archaeon]|nr:cytidylate kinase family protein [Candidatus Aenigmarchaeota archaeon]
MIITISGKPGSGKSTVAKIIAKKLAFKHYSIGDFLGKMAKERNITLEQIGELAKKDESIDKQLDNYQLDLGKSEDNFIIDSRIGFNFIPHSVKIFIDVDLKIAAERVFKDQRDDEEEKDSVQSMLKAMKKRIDLEKERYKKYYGIEDFHDSKHYDYVIDSTHITAEQVADNIIKFIKTRIAEGVKNVLKNNKQME